LCWHHYRFSTLINHVGLAMCRMHARWELHALITTHLLPHSTHSIKALVYTHTLQARHPARKLQHFIFGWALAKTLSFTAAWWGFTSAADRQRMEALVKRGVRSGLWAADTPNLTELIESSDDALFSCVLCNQDHILFPLLPDERDFTYNLRKRNHNRLLAIKQGRLCSCNFITRMLFKACYRLCSTSFYSRYFSLTYMYYCVIVAFCQHVLTEHAMLCYAMLCSTIFWALYYNVIYSLTFDSDSYTWGTTIIHFYKVGRRT